jgi:hypothetical protein
MVRSTSSSYWQHNHRDCESWAASAGREIAIVMFRYDLEFRNHHSTNNNESRHYPKFVLKRLVQRLIDDTAAA